MKKTLQTNLSRVLGKAAILFLLTTISQAAEAQLNGNYTIDTLGTNTGTNFRSFRRFATALRAGVSGPVTVQVRNGPYTEQVSFDQVSGASSTNTITIKGNSRTIQFTSTNTAARWTWRMNGADWFVIDSLNIRALGSANAVAMAFRNQSDRNIVRNCILDVPNVSNTAAFNSSTAWNAYSAIISFNASETTASLTTSGSAGFGQNGSGNLVENCQLNGAAASTVTGPQCGIIEMGVNALPNTSYQTNNIYRNNRIKNVYHCGIALNLSNGSQATGNEIFRDRVLSLTATSQTFYGIYVNYPYGSANAITVDNNYIHDVEGPNTSVLSTSSWPYNVYGIYSLHLTGNTSNLRTQYTRNRIVNNEAGGYMYGIFLSSDNTYDADNNLIATNIAALGTYGFYAIRPTNSRIRHNTVHGRPWTSYSPSFHYLFFVSETRTTNNSTDVIGNLVNNEFTSGTQYSFYTNGVQNFRTLDYNSSWNRMNNTPYWNATGGAMTLANYTNMLKGLNLNWTNNLSVRPKFADPNNLDFRPMQFALQNIVQPQISTDLAGVARNPIRCDVGARFNFTDLRMDSLRWNGSTTVCSGFGFNPTIRIFNNYGDTAFQFPVTFRLGNGTPVTEMVQQVVPPNSSFLYTFKTRASFNVAGNIPFWVAVNLPDDNRANDTIRQTITVLQGPTGGVYSPATKATQAVYRSNRNSDVTMVGEPIAYQLSAPKMFNNAGYGTDWTVSAYAVSSGGVFRPQTEISTTPATTTSAFEVSWVTNDTKIEDSLIWIVTKVTNLKNGCDTFIQRQVLLYPKIVTKLSVPSKICDGSEVIFVNKSQVKSGNMEFTWNFGTGKTEDTSGATEPAFIFPGSGMYKVKLKARTVPFGFTTFDSLMVKIDQKPEIKFTCENACEGKPVKLTNLTTPAGTTYRWEYGDGRTSTQVNGSNMYAKPGPYKVKLIANYQGCVAEKSQIVYQFPKPKAGFQISAGTCDNTPFQFLNKSVISDGELGYKWKFGASGDVSTTADPVYQFGAAGTYKVVLLATSEFGCTDSSLLSVNVKESPKPSFVFGQPCISSDVIFTNTTPVVSNALATYKWEFEGLSSKTTQNAMANWAEPGPRKITLSMNLDNGCSASISQVVNIGVKPAVNFSAADVCSGEPVVFYNNTTWPQGTVVYEWDFGDNTTSGQRAPVKNYNLTSTTSFNVTLKASVIGGCTDSLTRKVTINEGPATCDFSFQPDYTFGYWGVNLKPVNTTTGMEGGQNNVTYSWVFDGGGTISATGKDAVANYNFPYDGVFPVTMKARVDATGCECSKTKMVVMNRQNVNGVNDQRIVVYPNNTSGIFQIALPAVFGTSAKVEIIKASGELVYENQYSHKGNISVDAQFLQSGFYFVRVSSGDVVHTSRLTIMK
ncbi:MAG: T9SS type A sorting domain-containing protein [Bacteroidetes bacterium]|nr:T9SS type A sorting domain-containing protein [Bacteroidota bacterium]